MQVLVVDFENLKYVQMGNLGNGELATRNKYSYIVIHLSLNVSRKCRGLYRTKIVLSLYFLGVSLLNDKLRIQFQTICSDLPNKDLKGRQHDDEQFSE